MILLVKATKHGSAVELGDNLARHINIRAPAKSIFTHELLRDLYKADSPPIRNCHVIFIKHMNLDADVLKKIQNNNNKVSYVIVDEYPIKNVDFAFDCLIFSNKQQQLDFSRYFNFKKYYVYYHHYSPSYDALLQKTKNIGYFVSPENVSRSLKLPQIDIHTDFHEYKKYMSEYKFHIEYREDQSRHFLYKPCAKLSTAAFSESVFVCSKDCSYSELLPKDYPYFLTSIDSNLAADIIRSYNSDKYKYALDSMLNLKNSLNIHSTSTKFLDFIEGA